LRQRIELAPESNITTTANKDFPAKKITSAPYDSHYQSALIRRLERHFAHSAHFVPDPNVTLW
jgi:hypothetical protein